MRAAQSLLFTGLALIIASGCGSKVGRNGFGDDPTNGGDGPPDQQLNGGPGFGGDPAKNVVLDPQNGTVVIDTAVNPVVPGSVVYKVSKQGTDLTAGTTFTLKDSSLGSFSGAKFTSI